MLFFILLALIILLPSLFCNKKNKIIYYIIFLLLLFVGTFRGLDVGSDTKAYLAIYETIISDTVVGFIIVEPGWVILNLLSKFLFDDYRGVLFLSQLIILSFVFIRLWKSSYNPLLGVLYYVLLYYYLSSFNIARQGIALSIIFYSYPYILRKEKKRLFLIFLAICFHYSAAICLLIPYILKINLDRKSWITILILTFILGITIGSRLLHLIPAIGKYEIYLTDQLVDRGFSLSRMLLNGMFIILCLSIEKNGYLIMCFVGIIIYNLMPFSPAIGRIANYFMVGELLLFTNLKCIHMSNKIFVKNMLLVYGIVGYIILLNANSGGILPYELRL